MKELKFPSYAEVEEALKSADAIASPSEAHGLLSGLICVGAVADINGDSWARSIFPGLSDQVLSEAQMQTLSNLFEVTKKKVDELEFDFKLLLPNDEALLQKRAEELGYWCRGFIIGLNLGGFTEDKPRSEDCDEALQRMTDIANIDYESLDISEEDEVAYVEVIEYVRLAVLMIHAEVFRESDSGGVGHESKTIH